MGNFFTCLKPLPNNICVYLPDESITIVKFVGDVKIHDTLVLRDVLYVPSFKNNLLSVSKLTRNHDLKLTFHSQFCLIHDLKTDRVFAMGKLQEQLYIWHTESFQLSTDIPKQLTFSTNNCTDQNLEVCHFRMVHPSEHVLQHLPFYSNKRAVIRNCDVCKFPKQTKLPFPVSNAIAEENFDLLHLDIWGPYKKKSLTGAHYLLLLMTTVELHGYFS